jgi:putative membrane protein
MMYGWHDQGMNGGWLALMIGAMVIFWVVFVVGVVVVVRHYLHARPSASPASSLSPGDAAVSVLKERFAKGEVSEEEYTRRLKFLREEP